MEVAGQWRREWAGTAEYGKVTEGGVTRRVARAMEVLNASAPGARVRVMRAAYHSTSGPGVPAASFMLHSSRRVISSGFNILESPTFPTRPLEISSTPLESSPESMNETENYKVTEPDDMDISEPSKWRGTTRGSSIRMPSEESSSTDNASIIDLDSRFSRKSLHRKYSYDSENSDVLSLKRESTRASPLLDAPVTLSTLKYKSLLNSSNDWNNRRKSYSFEDASPLNEIILQSNDTLAMESSTDSGICKSSELVNDFSEDSHGKNYAMREKKYSIQDTIDHWQRKNQSHPSYKSTKMKTYKKHDIVIEEPHENNIALQSKGKLTITVPMTIEGEEDEEYKKNNDDEDRKVKKVGFCKTELHFAAESGRVNIIATDEKPPPTNDFRKRKSAFVPIKEKFEKPITLFGEKGDFLEVKRNDEYTTCEFSEVVECDENTAATKSILKNKIPKPKPYLLGENMAFGNDQDKKHSPGSPVPIGVSLINKELQANRICTNTRQSLYNSTYETRDQTSFTNSIRTTNKGPSRGSISSSNNETSSTNSEKYPLHTRPQLRETIKGKSHVLQMSPEPKPKTRQLRDSDLTYFGIANHGNTRNYSPHKNNRTEKKSAIPWTDPSEDAFESVRLVKKYSNSAQNSDAESTDSHDYYQNIPLKTNFAPVPTPRSRIKDDRSLILNPISEQLYDSNKYGQEPRRSRSRKQDDLSSYTSRSLSAPAKNHIRNTAVDSITRTHEHRNEDTRTTNCIKENTKQRREGYAETKVIKNDAHKEDIPLYANIDRSGSDSNQSNARRAVKGEIGSHSTRVLKEKKDLVTNKMTSTESDSLEKKQPSESKTKHRVRRTEKLSTPDNTNTLTKNGKNKLKPKSSLDNSSIKDDQLKNRSKTNKDNKISSQINDIKDLKIPKSSEIDNIVKSNGNTINKIKNMNEAELPRSNKASTQRSSDYRNQSKNSTDKNGTDRANNNTHGRRSSRRSEYVIKYDDKNGTVSSVCKVRSGHSTPRKKHVSKERNKEYTKDSKSKNTEHSALRNAAPSPSDSKRKK